MTSKIFGGAVLFFAACLLIWLAVKVLASVWGGLLLLAVITVALVIYIRLKKNRSGW